MPESHEPVAYHELTDDEKQLAKLGYSQDLHRSWSGFSNFAISFSIISILAGCFTNFGARLQQRRPGRHRLGSGRSSPSSSCSSAFTCPSWCRRTRRPAASTGGPPSSAVPRAGFFTGWLNLIGLVAIVAAVAYGCATFIDAHVGT